MGICTSSDQLLAVVLDLAHCTCSAVKMKELDPAARAVALNTYPQEPLPHPLFPGQQHCTRSPQHTAGPHCSSDHNSILCVTNFPLTRLNLLPSLFLLFLRQLALIHGTAVVVLKLLVLERPGTWAGKGEISAAAVTITQLYSVDFDVDLMLEGPSPRVIALSPNIFNFPFIDMQPCARMLMKLSAGRLGHKSSFKCCNGLQEREQTRCG